MIKSYKKRPVEIQALEYTGTNIMEVLEFIEYKGVEKGGLILINTLEGLMTASVGDYIIKGIKGEFYPCKPDVFAKTYEEVN